MPFLLLRSLRYESKASEKLGLKFSSTRRQAGGPLMVMSLVSAAGYLLEVVGETQIQGSPATTVV